VVRDVLYNCKFWVSDGNSGCRADSGDGWREVLGVDCFYRYVLCGSPGVFPGGEGVKCRVGFRGYLLTLGWFQWRLKELGDVGGWRRHASKYPSPTLETKEMNL